MSGAHKTFRHGHASDEALEGQSPPAGLSQIILVLVKAAEPQRDGGSLAPLHALHPRLLQRVRVDVKIGGRVVLVVTLETFRGLDELELRPRGARAADAASRAFALRTHTPAPYYVAENDRLDLRRAIIVLLQAETLLGQPHLVVGVLLRRHVKGLLQQSAGTQLAAVLHGEPMTVFRLTGNRELHRRSHRRRATVAVFKARDKRTSLFADALGGIDLREGCHLKGIVTDPDRSTVHASLARPSLPSSIFYRSLLRCCQFCCEFNEARAVFGQRIRNFYLPEFPSRVRGDTSIFPFLRTRNAPLGIAARRDCHTIVSSYSHLRPAEHSNTSPRTAQKSTVCAYCLCGI